MNDTAAPTPAATPAATPFARLGGPQLYVEKYGHPRLRARHLPFAIANAEAEQWMPCMRTAMAEAIGDEALRAGLDKALDDLAFHLRNRNDPPAA